MSKIIDMNRSIYHLTEENPELVEIMEALGFTDITKPGMIKTAGRFMTLTKGATLKKISLEEIIKTLKEYGFEVRR